MSSTGDQYYKHYKPSLAAAAIFTVLFTATTVFHCWQMIRRRTWYFVPFIIGGIFQIAGYLSRAISSTQYPDSTLGPYIIQALLLLLSPALYAASIYMVLGRIIRATGGEALSFIRVTWLTKIFVLGDVLSFLIQCVGGALLANADTVDAKDRGEMFITIGLIIQLIFFGLFIIVSIHFNVRLRKNPTDASRTTPVSWELYLRILYLTSGLILVRSVFRLIEYVQGEDGELLSNEIYLYIFDATLMFLVMVIFNWKHPSILIPYRTKVQTSSVSDVEVASDNYLMQERERR
ncbi:Rta-like protein [Neofusicoccum parvum]|uniref:Rta-like protein n=1 Tax=Neofusicoccum parvum TaxID=310453 RepID=A0ACB5SG73_9PEZI|nr:Rta-like protein [Neofusicoccum parvum]GME52775.1 Rta-like protein [Neofusicoccum parvum]